MGKKHERKIRQEQENPKSRKADITCNAGTQNPSVNNCFTILKTGDICPINKVIHLDNGLSVEFVYNSFGLTNEQMKEMNCPGVTDNNL